MSQESRRAKRLRSKGDDDGTESNPGQPSVLRGVVLVDAALPAGVAARSGDTREDHRPGPGHHQGAGPRSVRDASRTWREARRASATTNSEGLFQVNYLLPGTYQVTVELDGLQEAHPGQGAGPDQRDPRPGDRARGRRPGGSRQRHRRKRRAQHLGREHGVHRGLEAPRGAAADPRRPVQDHGARDRPRPLGRPAAGSAVRADAHHRLRLRRHAQQPQRPADRRRAEHRHGERQRGHRDLRPALRPGPGVQGADRDLRRPVRQHRGRRHQHEHQVRDEPPPRLGLLLRRADEPGARTTSSGRREARSARTAPRTGPASRLTGPVRIPGLYDGADKTFFTVGYERIKDVRPRFDAAGRRLGPDRGAAQRRLLRLLVEHHDLRSADPRPRPAAGSTPGSRSPATSSRQNRISPVSRRRSWSTTRCRRAPASTATSTTRRCRRRPTTTPSRPASTRRSPNANKMFVRYSWYKRDSNYNDYLDSAASGTCFQFMSYQAVIDDVHVFNPTTVLNVRYGYNRFERNSGAEAGRAELRPDAARLPRAVQHAGSRGQPVLPAPRLRRQHHDRRGVRQRLPADHLAHGRRHAEQVAGRSTR